MQLQTDFNERDPFFKAKILVDLYYFEDGAAIKENDIVNMIVDGKIIKKF